MIRSMRLLLDSHAFLWAFSDERRLSAHARAAIAVGSNELWLSYASLWELTIKLSLGRLRLDGRLLDLVGDSQVRLLPIELRHIQAMVDLPLHHGDPFDRMLAAQAREEGLTLVTADSVLHRYPVAWLW